MIDVNQLTIEDVYRLRNIYGTNNTSVSVSSTEIKQMKERLEVLYPNCKVQWSFAERICFILTSLLKSKGRIAPPPLQVIYFFCFSSVRKESRR